MKTRGNNVISANQARIQVQRHRVGQLDSLFAVPQEELEAMRTETAERLKTLEQMYWGKKEASEVGPKIRDKYKDFAKTSDTNGDDMEKTGKSGKGDADGVGSRTPGILKNAGGQKDGGLGRSGGRSGKRSKSLKKKRYGSPGASMSPDDGGRMTDDVDGEEGESLAKPKFSYKNVKKSNGRSRSKSGKASKLSASPEMD